MVVEGLNALPAALKLGKKYGVELPIIEGVHQIVDRGVSPRAMVGELMRRERKPEKLDVMGERHMADVAIARCERYENAEAALLEALAPFGSLDWRAPV